MLSLLALNLGDVLPPPPKDMARPQKHGPSQSQISFDKVREVRAAPRAFGAWGDMVIVMKDGSQLELMAMENYKELKEHIERCAWTLK
jgi:hypothetical protein